MVVALPRGSLGAKHVCSSVRVILTILAVALVTLLTAALIVPYFVDWSAHRAEIAERLELLTGGRVDLAGPVTLRLLPTPYLEVGAGSAAGAGPGAPTLTFSGARFELALVKLASGAFRFTDVRLERPVLTLARTSAGALALPAPTAASARAVGFDRFSVRDGTIRILAGGRAPEWTIRGVELDGDALSLAGPYHLSGRIAGPGGAPIVFRLVSETADAAGAPVRVTVEAGPLWPALDIDGIVAASGPKGLDVAGTATLSGTASGVDGSIPWRAAGRLVADLDGATLTHAEYQLGSEERAIRAEGSATLDWRAPARLAVDAKAKQANIDALLRRKGEDAVPPVRAATALAVALAPALAAAGPATLAARLAVESAIVGGDTLAGVAASLEAKPGEPLKTRFDVGLPGASRVRGEGEVETGAAAKFVGTVDFSTGDAAALGHWAGQGAPELAAWPSALVESFPSSSLAVSGGIEAAAVGFSGKNLRIALGPSILTGALAVIRPVGADAGRIYADLTSDALDVEALPSLDDARSLVGGYDLSLALDAKALRVAHVGEDRIDGASLALKLERSGSKLTLDRLALAGLGGAAFEATGAAGPDGASATGRLDADRLAEFAALVSRLVPGPWSRALAARAPLLSPASIAFEARAGPSAGDAPSLQALTARGTLARTRASLDIEPAANGGVQALGLVLDSPDSAALLRQLGLGAEGAAGQPGAAGHLELKASGAWTSGFDVDASASLGGAALSARGRYTPTAEGDDARLFGSVKLAGDNVAPLAAVVGFAPSGGAIGPVEASADVTLRGDRRKASRFAASVAGVQARGALVYQRPAERIEAATNPDLSRAEEAVNGPGGAAAASPPPALTGELSLDRLRLADLAALGLGPSQPAGAGRIWSEAKFAPPPLVLPPAALRVNVGALILADGLALQGFSTNLRLDKGRLDLDGVAMRLAGAAASGHATLRRSGEIATLAGALSVEPAPVGRPGFSGRIGAQLEFASTGRSLAALIAGLAGGGTVDFVGASLARSDPAALGRVVATAQAPDAQIDETNIAYELGADLDKGALAIPDGSTPVALSAGTFKLGPLAIAEARAAATLTASLDLAHPALATRLQLTVPATGLKFWAGPPPSALVTVADALDAPKRRLDVAGLAAGLATQAIARESDRIDNLEADIRERAFFNRRLKGERFLDRRKEEIEDWRAEQDRLKGLSQHLAEQREEGRLAAEKAAAEKTAVEKAAAEKAAAERAAAEKAAVEKAAAEKATASPEGPSAGSSPNGEDNSGGGAPPAAAPQPPPRPKPPSAVQSSQPVTPTAGSLY